MAGVGLGSVVGLLLLLATAWSFINLQVRERSLRAEILGGNLISGKVLYRIISKFTDDENRMRAFTEVLKHDAALATKVVDRVRKVDIKEWGMARRRASIFQFMLVVDVGVIAVFLLVASRAHKKTSALISGPPPEVSCSADENLRFDPYVVDREGSERADIDLAMNDGVAIVHYDCHSLTWQVLSGCFAAGEYAFSTVQFQRTTAIVSTADQLTGTLPQFARVRGGILFPALARGDTVRIEVAMTGKRRTTVQRVMRSALRGGDACAGATHFIRAAYVGSFLTRLQPNPKSSTVDEQALVLSTAGELDTCSQLPDNIGSASTSCRATVQVELIGLDAPAEGAGASAQETRSMCPAGFVRSEHKCDRADSAGAHSCEYGDIPDCDKECRLADDDSCINLGVSYSRADRVERDVSKAAALFQRSCNRNHALGCTNLGNAFEAGIGVPRDVVRAAALYRQACDADEEHGCYRLARLNDLGNGFAQDLPLAAMLYRKACNAGEGYACTNLGALYERGRGVDMDATRAFGLYKLGCDALDAMGCLNLGIFYSEGRGGTQDYAKAASAYRLACDGANAQACTQLGSLLARGLGVPKDPSQAATLYEKGCNGHNAMACSNLGGMYEDGTGVAKDVARATELYEMACDANDSGGCINLGSMYARGSGVQKDLSRAAALLQRACAGKDPEGCADLGICYEHGDGVGKDLARARTLYRTSCEHRSGVGCNSLGLLYGKGLGVPVDYKRAADLFGQSCDLKYPEGCGNLANSYYRGAGVAQDKVRGVALFGTSCEAGDNISCDVFRRLAPAPAQ